MLQVFNSHAVEPADNECDAAKLAHLQPVIAEANFKGDSCC